MDTNEHHGNVKTNDSNMSLVQYHHGNRGMYILAPWIHCITIATVEYKIKVTMASGAGTRSAYCKPKKSFSMSSR